MNKDEIPPIIHPLTVMKKPNEFIKIYSGNFNIKTPKEEYPTNGKIFFSWFPHTCIKFEGKVLSKYNKLIKDFNTANFEVIINVTNSLKCYLTSSTHSKEVRIEGMIIEDAIIGEKID